MTCWVSAAFSDSETNVSLTLSLHKKFEVCTNFLIIIALLQLILSIIGCTDDLLNTT